MSPPRSFLYGNQIRRIPEGAFAGLPALKRLRLDDNPLECDCSLLWFRRVLHEARQTLLATSSCATPEQLVGKSLADLGEDDFHCSEYCMQGLRKIHGKLLYNC